MTVFDFGEYRMRMRAGTPATQRSYYLVGLTHGVREGESDPDLRGRLVAAIRATDRHAVVHDPLATWHRVSAAYSEDRLAEFHRLTSLAAGSEVCVAWLPTRDSITNAVAELQSAHRGGATVVAITNHPDDFLVRAYATIVLPDLAAFTEWVQAA